MILFVFEGQRDEKLFRAMCDLYGSDFGESITYTYTANIYTLYSHLKKLDGDADVVRCIKNRCKDVADPIMSIGSCDDVSQVFLFFDYDFHHHEKGYDVDVEGNICKVSEMLSFFDNETEHGKIVCELPYGRVH